MLRKNISILLSLFAISFLFSESYGQGFKATFTPLPRSFPGFGNVVIGKSKDQTIRIFNDPTSVGSVTCSLTIANGSVFSVIGPMMFILSPGQSDTITVHFKPDSIGLFRDTLSITHNADTSSNLKNPARYFLSGAGTPPDTLPKISVSTGGFGTFISFGTATIGKTISKTFTIKNVSDTIRKLIGTITAPTSSRYSIASGGGAFSLDTGMTVTVTVNFSPDTVAQFLVDSVIVNSNSSSPNNRIKVTLFGTGIKPSPFPRITVGGIFGGSINFRTDTIGHPPKTASFTITNTSDSTRTLTGTISNPNSPFSIVSGGGNFTLDSGKSVTVQLAFTATTIGTFRDTITISSNSDPANPPIKIPLIGVGYTVTGPHIIVQPAMLNFGTNKFGSTPLILILSIKNKTDSAKDVLSGSVSSPNPPFVIKSGSGGFTIFNNDSTSIKVSMATDKSGTFQDSIVLISNSNDNAQRLLVRIMGIVSAQGGVKDGEPGILNFITAIPNPFTGRTAISFSLNGASPVSMKIYDILGKEMFAAPEHNYPAGTAQIEWNASGLEDGTYLCVVSIGKEARAIRVVLRK